MNNYPPQFNQQAYEHATYSAAVSRISRIMKRVYVNMTLGLLVTDLVSHF